MKWFCAQLAGLLASGPLACGLLACGDSSEDSSSTGGGPSSSASTGTTPATSSSGAGGGAGGAEGGGGEGGGSPDDPSCRLGWCWIAPSIDGSTFRDVTVDANGDVWFSSEQRSLLRWDGTEFHRYEVGDVYYDPREAELFIVDENDIWLDGDVHFDGSTWTDFVGPQIIGRLDDGTLLGVLGDSILAWDGSDWVEAPSPPAGTEGSILAWGGTIDSFQLLASNGSVRAYEAGGWAALAPSQGWSITRDRALAFSDGSIAVLQAFNYAGEVGIHTFDGDWSLSVAVAAPDTFAGTSPSDVTIYAGPTGRHRYHWDGSNLTDLGAYDGFVYAAVARDDGTVFEAGFAGLLRSFAAGTETSLQEGPFPGQAGILDFVPAGPATSPSVVWIDGTLWTVTDRAAVLRFDGTTWSTVDLVEGQAHGIWGITNDDIWFVGDRLYDYDDFMYPLFEHFVHRYDGSSVTSVPSTVSPYERAFGVWGTDSANVFVWGYYGAYRFDGTSWTVDTRMAHHGTTANNIWASTGTTLDRFDGQSWTSYPFMEEGLTRQVYSFGNDDVWALHDGKLYGLSGGALFQKTLPPNVGPLEWYLRTPAEHHLFFGRTLWSFSGDDPMTGTAFPTFFVPSGAAVDTNGTIYARVDGGVVRRQ